MVPERGQIVDITERSHVLKQFIHILPEPLREHAETTMLY